MQVRVLVTGGAREADGWNFSILEATGVADPDEDLDYEQRENIHSVVEQHVENRKRLGLPASCQIAFNI